jgi:uncharacterized protein YgiM (DUF1202 family)
MKATAGLAALSAAGIAAVREPVNPAAAQEVGGTRARRYVPAEEGTGGFSTAAVGDWQAFQADYEFFALGASWDGGVGLWPVVEVQLGNDGATWGETIQLVAQTDDGGRPNRDDRLFTALAFTDGVTWVRYRTVDINGVGGEVAGLSFVYIDPSDGPWEDDIVNDASTGGSFTTASTDTLAPPEIITREEWGANERWRFDAYGEIWPPEYETVTHIIIHHTATGNRPLDVPGAIRSIYYYHAVEQGWGDIGYNYLVDHNGRIYQGRYGGQNVIGGHSYQFAIGSSGISAIGNFQTVDISEAAKSALVAITAWVGRDLDPNGSGPLQEAPNLPTIASHRDVNATTCPGDRLWNDLPEIRDLVAATLDSGTLNTGLPAGIVPGDRVKVQTDDGSALNVRSTPRGYVVDSLPNGQRAYVVDGPDKRWDGNFYRIEWAGGTRGGWATAKYLIVDPFPPPASDQDDYVFGLNVRFNTETNIRRGPGTSGAIIRSVPRNTWAHIMAGPTVVNGQDWYQVRVYNIGDGWVIKSNITPAPVTRPAGNFRVGDQVETTASVNIRPRPGLAQGVISTQPAGARFQITQPAIGVTDYIWYGVFNDAVGGGWVVQNYLRKVGSTPPPPTGKFAINDLATVTETLNLRSAASTSASLVAVLPAGTSARILAGPRSANGYTWWQIRTSRGTGWAVENWLTKTSGGAPPPPSGGKFAINSTVRVTESLNLRSSASTSGSVIAVLSPGTTGTVLGGPRSANEYTWWQLRTSAGTGWAVENWLTAAGSSSSPAPGGYAAGTTLVVSDGPLNMRSGASISSGVVAVLPTGSRITVVSGPSSGSGYTWYQVRSSTYGTGWVVSNFVSRA